MAASAIPLPRLPSVEFDAQLLRRMSRPGPRYTSYPAADRFNDAFGYRDYLQTVAFPVSFTDYFAAELGMLAALARDGLLTVAPDWISVTLKGRLLIRNICMVFDRYLGADRVQRFSQTI